MKLCATFAPLMIKQKLFLIHSHIMAYMYHMSQTHTDRERTKDRQGKNIKIERKIQIKQTDRQTEIQTERQTVC